MNSCRIEGCSSAAIAKGLCAKHYMRVVRTGNPAVKHKPGPKPKPGGRGEVLASLQAEIAALKTRLAAKPPGPDALALQREVGRLKAENDKLQTRIISLAHEVADLQRQLKVKPKGDRRSAAR